MSRRRSSDPAMPVSIAIPRSLFTRLNELLSWRSSRSKWVCDAIRAKLDAHSVRQQTLNDISNGQLLFELQMRQVIDEDTYTILKSNLLAAETVTKQ